MIIAIVIYTDISNCH